MLQPASAEQHEQDGASQQPVPRNCANLTAAARKDADRLSAAANDATSKTGKADMGQANHLWPPRGDPRQKGVVPLRFLRDLDQPVSARRTRVRVADQGPTDEHRPRG
jgi:hypothetical protein